MFYRVGLLAKIIFKTKVTVTDLLRSAHFLLILFLYRNGHQILMKYSGIQAIRNTPICAAEELCACDKV
jgi:hypothetical protein